MTFDRVGLLDRMGGDATLAGQVVAVFREELPGMVSRVRTAATEGDLVALAEAAHKLRGSAATVGFMTVAALALDLEGLARERTLETQRITSFVAQLEMASDAARQIAEGYPSGATA